MGGAIGRGFMPVAALPGGRFFSESSISGLTVGLALSDLPREAAVRVGEHGLRELAVVRATLAQMRSVRASRTAKAARILRG
jgi:hypothetical protein